MLDAPVQDAGAMAHPFARVLPMAQHRVAGRGQGTARAIPEPGDPGVRWSRVMSARARLASGFYDRLNVRGRIADAVLRELQIP